jgi:hypothetical protein
MVRSTPCTGGRGGDAEKTSAGWGNQSTKIRAASQPYDQSNPGGLRKLGSLPNRNHYEYSEDEVQRIFATIEEAVADAKGRFLGRRRREFRL